MMRCSLITLASACAITAQDRTESVPFEVRARINSVLPERSSAGAAFLSESYSPNVVVSEACELEVVVLWEGAGYQNSLGYFTYRNENDGSVTILSANIIERNVSFPGAGSLQIGHTWALRDANGDVRAFQPGENVGFFVIADGNRRAPELNGYVPNQPGIPADTGEANAAVGRGIYTTIPSLNVEFARGAPDRAGHLAMLWMPGVTGFLGGEDYLLCGFEDLNRMKNSDEDFNDLVFVVSGNPIEAIEDTEAFRYNPGDPDGDGVSGLADHFPEDPERVTSTRYPNVGWNVIAFEDNYPGLGDADYNDAVIAYAFEEILDASGNVKDVIGTFHLVARGAAYDHSFGVHLPGIPVDATGTVKIERVIGGANPSQQPVVIRTVQALIADQRRLGDVFPSTTVALPPPAGDIFSNTRFDPAFANAGSTRVHIEFTAAVGRGGLGLPPYDPYLALNRYGNGIWDIHLPGRPAFSDRSTHLPPEVGASSFIDSNGMPWAIEVPRSWRFPMESRDVRSAYSDFLTWAASGGQQKADWYLRANSNSGQVSKPLQEIIPAVTWTVDVPR